MRIDMGIFENMAWIKDFRQRFDSDINYLTGKEPLWKTCAGCRDGHCCGHDIYPATVSQLNPYRLEEWWLMLEYVRDNFSVEEKKKLVRNVISDRPDCIFLFGNRCSIYPARAWSCRLHPFTISFHPSSRYFPTGEIALPSCPALSPVFGLKKDELFVQRPEVISKDRRHNLVQLKLKKHKPLWLMDATEYVEEYENHVTGDGYTTRDWEALLDLAGQAGDKGGIILQLYIEKMQGIQRLPDGKVIIQ